MLVGWVLIGASAAAARQPEAGDLPVPEDETPVATAQAPQGNEIGLKIRRIGVGDRARPADWAGFQVELNETSTKARNVIVQVDIPDADGDRAMMRRAVSTTPNQTRSVWLYGWLPRGEVAGSQFRFTVYEATVTDDSSLTGIARYIAGRQLAVRVFQASQRTGIESSESLIGIVGLATGGLDQYPASRDQQGLPPTGHEITELAAGMKPDDLPDHWQGLMPFEAIVWTGQGAEFEPSDIDAAQALALREWVKRGGHLVIVLPSVGQAWYGASGSINPIADIMPIVTPVLQEGVDLNDYRSLFTKDQSVSFGTRRDAALFRLDATANGVGPYDAMPILVGPNNQTVVVRRLVGTGAVTVLGIDPTRRDLGAKNALQAHVFWHRILGKRLPIYSQAEINVLQSGVAAGGSGSKATARPPQYRAERLPVELDAEIPERISKSVSAVKGLLMAFVVFTAYWLLAGPVGFFMLKQRNRQQDAWVAFLAVAAIFTLVGWAGAKVLRLGRDADKHLTLIDHVYGQSNQRMRSWVELTLPKYGEQKVSVAAPPIDSLGTASEWHNTITAWQPSGINAGFGSFPDARGYVVDARYPDSAEYPARATTRQLQIDYAGAVPRNWGMPRPLIADPEQTPLGQEMWIEELARPLDKDSNRLWKINGVLMHDLPGELRDVVGVVVLGQSRFGRMDGVMQAEAYSFNRGKAWLPKEPLDLEAAFGKEKLSALDFNKALEQWRGKTGPRAFVPSAGMAARPFDEAMYGLAFYPMLTPPDPQPINNSEYLVERRSTQCWDLGRWFTQPCVIIVGILGDKTEGAVECPIPISIDGRSGDVVRKQIKGTTVIRWVYPLKPRPPTLTKPTLADPDAVDGAVSEKPI